MRGRESPLSLNDDRRELLKEIAQLQVLSSSPDFFWRKMRELAERIDNLAFMTDGEIVNELARRAHDYVQAAKKAEHDGNKELHDQLMEEAHQVWKEPRDRWRF